MTCECGFFQRASLKTSGPPSHMPSDSSSLLAARVSSRTGQDLVAHSGVAGLGSFVVSRQENTLLPGIQAAGDPADGLAGFLQVFLVQVKVKTGAAVPGPAVGLDAGRR